MKHFKMVLFLLVMLIVGCVTTADNLLSISAREGNIAQSPSLLVQNTGIDVIRIYENGRRIASIYPGQSECILLRAAVASSSRLSFGQLASDQRWYSVQESFAVDEGWVWNINTSSPTFSEIDIYPSERCD